MIAIVWRKSVYDTGKCPKCGAILMDANGDPCNVYEGHGSDNGAWLFCQKCGMLEAALKTYDGSGNPGDKMGRWDRGLSLRGE